MKKWRYITGYWLLCYHGYCSEIWGNILLYKFDITARTAIKGLYLYLNLCLSVMLDNLSCSFTSISNYLCSQCLSPLKVWVQIVHRQGVLHTTLCDKVGQWLGSGQLFSPSTMFSSTNKTDRYDITEILLKVGLNTINLHPFLQIWSLLL